MSSQIHLHVVDPTANVAVPPVSAPRRRPRSHGVPRIRSVGYSWYPTCKLVLEFVLAVVLLVPAFVVVTIAAVLVRLTSRGPAFYTQVRVGKDGRRFTIYKIRTMIDKCESLTGARWSMPGDPRITPVGWFLRRSHIDELPQLLNVLKGEMSLVGPRPERPEFIPELEEALPMYRQRLQVRPGVTGLAQVQLPPDTDVGSVRRKLAHDLYYIQHSNPWMDLALLFGTFFYAVGIPGRIWTRFLGIPQSRAIEQKMESTVEAHVPEQSERQVA